MCNVTSLYVTWHIHTCDMTHRGLWRAACCYGLLEKHLICWKSNSFVGRATHLLKKQLIKSGHVKGAMHWYRIRDPLAKNPPGRSPAVFNPSEEHALKAAGELPGGFFARNTLTRYECIAPFFIRQRNTHFSDSKMPRGMACARSQLTTSWFSTRQLISSQVCEVQGGEDS